MPVVLTIHAATRCQQRGIPDEALELLLDYGVERRRKGASVCFMDRRARRRAETDIGRKRFSRLARSLDAYVVVADDGAIITAAHRHGRLKF